MMAHGPDPQGKGSALRRVPTCQFRQSLHTRGVPCTHGGLSELQLRVSGASSPLARIRAVYREGKGNATVPVPWAETQDGRLGLCRSTRSTLTKEGGVPSHGVWTSRLCVVGCYCCVGPVPIMLRLGRPYVLSGSLAGCRFQRGLDIERDEEALARIASVVTVVHFFLAELMKRHYGRNRLVERATNTKRPYPERSRRCTA